MFAYITNTSLFGLHKPKGSLVCPSARSNNLITAPLLQMFTVITVFLFKNVKPIKSQIKNHKREKNCKEFVSLLLWEEAVNAVQKRVLLSDMAPNRTSSGKLETFKEVCDWGTMQNPRNRGFPLQKRLDPLFLNYYH